MSKRLIAIVSLFAAAAFLLFISEFVIRFAPGIQLNKPNIPRLERKIEKELELNRAEGLAFYRQVAGLPASELFERGGDHIREALNTRGAHLFLFINDTLCFWSSKIDVSDVKFDTTVIALQKIQSDYYFVQWKSFGNRRLLILSHLCSTYPYQNKYLKNSFAPAYSGLNDYSISRELVYNGIPVRVSGAPQFYLVPIESFRKSPVTILKPIFQWGGVAFMIVAIYLLFNRPFFRKRILLKVFGFAGTVLSIRALGLYYGLPVPIEGELFGPKLFAHSAFNASLGDFFINSAIVFIVTCYIFKNIVKISRSISAFQKVIAALLVPAVIGMYVLVDGMFVSLILHSTLTLETYRIFNISIYSLVGYFSIALWVVSAFLVTGAWLKLFYNSLKLTWTLLYLTFSAFIVFGCLYFWGLMPSIYSVFWMLFTVSIFIFIKYTQKEGGSLRLFLLILGFFSAYSVATVSHYSFQKEEDIRKVLAINLSSERDPVAEMLITPLYHKLLTDTVVRTYVRNINQYNVDLYNHLRKNYFNNYLSRYELRATVCLPNSVMAIDGSGNVNCNQFFNNLVDRYGVLIPSSRFYYLNLQNGSISYLGAIGYRYGDELRNLYIELDSRPSWELLGYPELLIEGRGAQPILKGYSWAKYHNGMLVTQAGDFPYRMKLNLQNTSKSTYDTLNHLGYNHLVYHPNSDDAVIISRKLEEPLNTTASLVYNFVFFFIVFWGLLKFAGYPVRLRSSYPSFKNRISRAISLIILLSMVMVAAVTIIYNIKNFNQRNEKNLSEKLLSVMFELDKDISLIYSPYSNADVLTDRLVELSNIFYTDINIYDTSGVLVLTSRPEMFEKRLLGRRMNPVAWNEMAYRHSPKYIGSECIGEMTYLSAYVPIVGSGNNTIAYLNLPYFTKQEELRGELYSIIVAIINIYALLALFAIIVAILISGQITRPLELIRERISMVNIAGNNEAINYSGNDEVGQLIREYNRMVEELAWSAKELARNQRESAWREMAKQIAHEVKNPLTPIKLSLQYLVKAKKDGVPDWDQRFEKFSQSLVEQINTLSSIASEFSSFAKLPMANISEVNLNTILSDVITLYSGYKNVELLLDSSTGLEPIVMADREQLLRVFNNLVKNAIQSIERGKHGIVSVSILKGSENSVRVEVADNGMGIPDDVLPKLFTPNFTTKSGGSGLGLAITREILLGFGGNIKVRTTVGEGSTFTVELPMEKQNHP